jgi:hypothetical protein
MSNARRMCGVEYRQCKAISAVLVALAAALGSACRRADSQAMEFNGRWNIKAEDNARVAWLDLRSAETGRPQGLFVVGTPDRSAGTYADLVYNVSNGVLRFEAPADREQPPRLKEIYRARIADGKLLGECIPASGGPNLRWIGERPPTIEDRDDRNWVSQTPVDLFKGQNLTAWRGMSADQPAGWEVNGDIMRNTVAHADNLVCDQKFWNFELEIEHRLPAGGKSGIGLRGRYEVCLLDDYGRPPFAGGHGALCSRIPPAINASKPAGEWQKMRIRLIGRRVTVVLNDRTVIDGREIDGLTQFASDPNESLPGPITIQGDRGLIEFRKIRVIPLTRSGSRSASRVGRNPAPAQPRPLALLEASDGKEM